MAAAEFSKFAGILRAALSQHHVCDLKKLNWNSITFTSFVVMLPKAYLTLHSRLSGSRLVNKADTNSLIHEAPLK